MALLGAYMLWKDKDESLADYLDNRVFSGAGTVTLRAEPEDEEGFAVFLSRYRKALAMERIAAEVL